ncbi:MAG TPA: amino acid ABC transporter substrate-binding protein [Candidatus Sulfotelmatobacter sp.]|nr:amino acid ABC transporter substrate-binding protein [Candidatus Sulfotelmatobacter sp.]
MIRMLMAAGAASVLATAALAADGPIKIGFGMAETGGLAGNGRAAVVALEMWAEDVNAKGGLLGRKVELIHYDDQSNPSQVPGIYTKLIDVDKVDLVLSGYGTNLTAPAMPIVMQRNMLFLSNFALAINDEFHYDRYFQIQPNGPDARHEFSKSFLAVGAMLNPKPKTIALVGADAEYPQAAMSGARDNLKNSDYKVVYDKTYPPNTVDYTPIVRAIQATDPDAVFIASYPPDTSGFVRAINEVGFKPKLLGGGMVGLQFAALKTQFGPLLNGIVDFEQYVPSPTMKLPGTDAFVKRYQAKAAGLGIDQLGMYLPPYAYAGGQVYAQAIAAVGSLDQGKLAQYIHTHKFDTIVGDIEFGDNGEWKTARILQTQYQGITDSSLDTFKKVGTQVILYPSQYKSGNVIPYDQAKK